jgi:hypothetical protein
VINLPPEPLMRRIATLLLLVGCRQPTPGSYTIDTLPNGAVLVTNHAPSGWADSSGIALVLERTIAPVDGEPGELSRPLEVRATTDGRVLVNDAGGAGILLFGADGSLERVVGRHGEGPGEYGDFFHIATHGTDELIVHECNRARVTRYSLDQDTTFQWPSDGCRGNAQPILDASGGVWLSDRIGGEDGSPRRQALFKRDATGGVVDTFPLPAITESAVWLAGGGAVPVPFSAYTVTVGAPKRAWTGHGNTMAFYRITRTGDTVLGATIPGEPAPSPDSIRAASIAWAANAPRFADAVKLADVPTLHPRFRALSLDERGRLWVHRPAADGTTGSFEVIDTTGVWLGTVPAPAGSLRELHWANGRIYRIGETPSGLPAIEIYRVQERQP